MLVGGIIRGSTPPSSPTADAAYMTESGVMSNEGPKGAKGSSESTVVLAGSSNLSENGQKGSLL